MKRVLFCTILALMLTLFTSCGKNLELNAQEVKANTLVVRGDGTIQAATVETFDKDYYNMEELSEFINKEINTYNSANGADTIVLNALEEVEGRVVLVLSYSNFQHYSAFNDVSINLVTVQEARNGEITMPEVLMNRKGETVSKEVALEKDKYKVLTIKDNTNVILDGKIMYYSNGTLVDSSEITASGEDETVVIYKP